MGYLRIMIGLLGMRKNAEGFAMPGANMLRLVRHDFNPYSTVGELNDGKSASLMDERLSPLIVRETMRDGDMTIAFRIDTRHLTAKEPAVGRGVTKLVDSDEIMDHLMEDGIFNEGFRQVNARIDTKDKVLVAISTKEPLFAAGKSHFAEKALRVGELDGDWRQRPAEIAGIELVKAGLDVRNRGFHLGFLIYGWKGCACL